jgi:hypothetical protein
MSDFGQEMSKSGQRKIRQLECRIEWHVPCIPYTIGYPVLWSKK